MTINKKVGLGLVLAGLVAAAGMHTATARQNPPAAHTETGRHSSVVHAASGGDPSAARAEMGRDSSVAHTAAGRDPSVVHTTAGAVRGTVADEHRTFLGIPYAATPEGELRWAPPEPAPAWSGTRDATAQGNACPQPTGLPVAAEPQGDDCLNLNVTTPARGRDLPVLVWVHGGSFVYGAGDSYGAASMAARGDAVVVTINYRLGALGFLAHPALPDSPNLGLADQQAALRWVRDNITAFGGDPGNVTLAGQSGGGYSVCAHLASPRAAGLFHRAIVQSAPCVGGTTHTREEAERQGLALAEELGCTDPATAATCLRAAPVASLIEAAGAGHDDFRPVAGTPLLPIDSARAIETGRFNRVPVLLGSNHDEEGGRIGGMELVPGAEPLTRKDYLRELRTRFGADAREVLATYPLARFDSPSEALTAVLTDHDWSRSTYDTLRSLSRHVPTYAYEFAERETPWHPGLPRPSFPYGASHMLELPYLFEVDYIEPAAQRSLRHAMIDYWTGFAAAADPNASDLPHWPRFQRGEYVQSLAAKEIRRTDFPADHHYDLWHRLSE